MRFEWTRPFVTLSTAVMEASWIYILVFVLTARPTAEMSQSVLSVAAVLGLLLGALLYLTLLDFLGLRARFYRLLFVLLVLFAALWLVKGGITGHYGLWDGPSWLRLFNILGDIDNEQFLRTITALGAAMLLCWRGASLQDIELETPARSFRLGIVVSSFSILFGAFFSLDLQQVGAHLMRAVLSFFFFGLLGIAVSQLRREKRGSQERPGARWFLIFLLSAGLIVLLGGALVAVIAPEDIGQLLIPAWDRIVEAIVWLVTPIVVAGYAVLNLLRWFLGVSPQTETLNPTTEPTPLIETVTPAEEVLPQVQPLLPVSWRYTITGVVIALIVAGMLYLIWLYLSRSRSTDDILEERESLWSWEEISFNLPDWLERLRQRLSPEQPLTLRALLEQLQGHPTTVSIRRAYIRLLLLALERDRPRREGQSPTEYLKDLQSHLPEHAAEAEILTAAYNRARYDPRPSPANLARQAEAAWERIDSRENAPS
ncbi:MAG: DUF4129 domain-containing protein [Chloroflexia bacterium]|nr:DUF4129 domain-containing protein [Chloroflexia bacterium]